MVKMSQNAPNSDNCGKYLLDSLVSRSPNI